MTPGNFYCPVGGTMGCTLSGTDCNGGTATFNANWTSSNTAIMTVNSSGVVTGVAPGTATISGQVNSYIEVTQGQVCSGFAPVCPTGEPGGSTGDNVTPTISGPDTVWWFNGQNPSGWATSITLTASPANAGSYTWDIVTGSNKATLTGQSGNTINVVGASTLSTSLGDVQITVTVNSVTSDYHNVTVRGPKTAVPGTMNDAPDSTWGYVSTLNYTIKDNLNSLLPSTSIGLNENWTTSVVPDYSGMNWRQSTAGGVSISNSLFADRIEGELSTMTPTPKAPQSPRSTTAVYHWGQEWRVGSTSPGVGARIQTDTLQKFVDHARHTNIVTPAP